MSQTRKLYQGQVAATATAVFTAQQPTRIVHLRAVNLDSSARTLKLWQGSAATDAYCVLPAISIGVGGWLEGGGLFLEKGESLYAQAAAATAITLTLFGSVNMEADDEPLAAFGFQVFDSAGRPGVVTSVGNLDDVGDVTLTDIADGDIVIYDTDAFVNTPLVLSALADALVTTPTDGDILVYDTDAFVNVSLGVAAIGRWLGVGVGPVTDPPTIEDLTSALGDPAATGPAVGLVPGTTAVYGAMTDGTDWWYWEITEAQSGA